MHVRDSSVFLGQAEMIFRDERYIQLSLVK